MRFIFYLYLLSLYKFYIFILVPITIEVIIVLQNGSKYKNSILSILLMMLIIHVYVTCYMF